MAQAWIGRKRSPIIAAYLKGKGEIKPEMPEKLAPVKEKELKVKGWPFDADRIKAMLADEKETRKEIELAPGIKMTFVRVPAGQFVMGSYRGQSDTRPTAKVKIDKAFWMGELEVTNQQFNVISRITTAVSWISNGRITWFKDIPLISQSNR